MVITNKRTKIPDSLIIKGHNIKLVNEFRLLGVFLDNKLNFNTHVSRLCLSINSKLFAIKRIFYLSTDVKIQFFKTFILPYFDYCSTLLIYFNKLTIQRLCNKFYLCLHLLFKIDVSEFDDYNQLNTFLRDKYQISGFQHRLFHRMAVFSFKLLNFTASPQILKSIITSNYLILSSFELNPLCVPENTRELRNRTVKVMNEEIISKTINIFLF